MSAKINQPSPQIFSSDPLEQIYAKSTLDPTMGGLAGMFMQILGNRRRMDQATYMQGVSESNQIAGRVAMQEAEAKHQQELLKGALKMAEMGQPGSTMPILQSIIQSGALGQGTDLQRRLMESKIAANSRDPNAGKNDVQVKVDQSPNGTGFHTITGKGPGAVDKVEAARQKVIELMKSGKATSVDEANTMLQRRNQAYGGGVPQ